jgi:hypothetical protein
MTLLLERLGVEVGRKVKMINNVLYASNKQSVDTILEPYNVVLASQTLIEHSNMIILNTNAGLSAFCQSHLNIESPKLKDLNTIQAKAFSHLLNHFISSDKGGHKLSSFDSVVTSLVLYPRLNMFIPSYAPKPLLSSDTKHMSEALTNQAMSPSYYLSHSTGFYKNTKKRVFKPIK